MKTEVIPWSYIDGLSYGEWDFFVKPFIHWLHSAPKVIFIPRAMNFDEHYSLVLATRSIKRIAGEMGKVSLKARKAKNRES
jgi:hypothetical protein